MSSFYFTSRRTRRHRRPLSLDFSAMSALGLMLVNFFMVQQLWEKPQVLPILMPTGTCDACTYGPENEPLTILCDRDKVYIYTGITDPKYAIPE